MEYLTVKEVAKRWGISDRRVRTLCADGAIDGIIRKGRSYLIPADAERPIDKRRIPNKKRHSPFKGMLTAIDAKKVKVDDMPPAFRMQAFQL